VQIADQPPIHDVEPDKGWRPKEAALIVFLGWLGGILCGFGTLIFLRRSLDLSLYEIRIYSLGETMGLCGMVLFPLPLVVRHVRKMPATEILKSISWGCPDRVFAIAGAVGLGFGFIHSALERYLGQRFVTEPGLYVLTFAVTAVATALIEEIYFRGILYEALRQRIGVFWSIGLVTILFCLTHGKSTYRVIPAAVLLGIIRVTPTLLRRHSQPMPCTICRSPS
jgi:membrane protease YdiL (CAAX protease family)